MTYAHGIYFGLYLAVYLILVLVLKKTVLSNHDVSILEVLRNCFDENIQLLIIMPTLVVTITMFECTGVAAYIMLLVALLLDRIIRIVRDRKKNKEKKERRLDEKRKNQIRNSVS